jgi:hypothetical protein
VIDIFTYRLKLPAQKDWFWICSEVPIKLGSYLSYDNVTYKVRRIYHPDKDCGSLVEVEHTKELHMVANKVKKSVR